MQFKLVQYKENMYASFWIIPCCMSLVAIVLAAVMTYADHSFVLMNLKQLSKLFIDAQSARQVLSIVALSVVTITSVTFSITVLILSIASNQLGLRLLPNFMRQKQTQFVLGFFIGTFIYSVIILQSMSLYNPLVNLPYLSITLALILGIVCFFLLVYFIHFVCHVIQIDNILIYLIKDIEKNIERQFKDRNDSKADRAIHKVIADDTHISNILAKQKTTTEVLNDKAGYIQTIDYDELFDIAEKNNLIIKIYYQPGRFILNSLPLMTVYSAETVDEKTIKKCLEALQTGCRRSSVQDVKFAFEELVEVAVRALSPGINNTYTAIHCIDRIVQGYQMLATKTTTANVVTNQDGEVRLIRERPGYSDIVESSFNKFRQQTAFNLSVVTYTLTAFERLLRLDIPDELSIALIKQSDIIYQNAKKNDLHEADKKELEQRYKAITVHKPS